MRHLVIALSLTAAAAFADDEKKECHITAGPHDLVKRHGDVVVEPGRQVDDVIALDGTITVKPGASVKTAIALKGDVLVQPGAVVRDTAITLKGQVKVEKAGSVKSVVEVSRRGIHVVDEDGQTFDFNAAVNGSSLGSLIVSTALSKVKDCTVVEKD